MAVGQRQRLYSGVRMFTGNYLSSTPRDLRARGVYLELRSLILNIAVINKFVTADFRKQNVTAVLLLKPPRRSGICLKCPLGILESSRCTSAVYSTVIIFQGGGDGRG